MQEIFKIDSKGKMRTIRYSTDGNKLIMESGLVGGNLARTESMVAPKNIGKSNEVTGATRALAMIESKIKTKTRKEYFMSQEDAQSGANDIYPMLAKDYFKEEGKVEWEIGNTFVQPKLDGIRCLAFVDNTGARMMSRSNKEIITLPHIKEALRHLPSGIYDGELYAHGLSFQENTKLINKDRGEASKLVHFHMYDMASADKFSDRHAKLVTSEVQSHSKYLWLVHTSLVVNIEDLKTLHTMYLSKGYEGAMLRWGEESYKSKGRSNNLLKYKIFDDMDSVIIDVVPQEARPDQGMLVCTDDLGITFTADFAGTHAERTELLERKAEFIGKTALIRFFGRTDAKIPRFAKAVGFKE